MEQLKKILDQAKKGKYSRQKGKGFEYQCKKLISQYLDIPYEYMETPFDRKGQPLGDLFIAGKYWDRLPLYCDFKKRENFQLQSLFSQFERSGILSTWIAKSRTLLEEDRDFFVLIWSKNHYPIFIFGVYEVLSPLIDWNFIGSHSVFISKFLEKKFVMFNFKEFLLARRNKLGL